MQSPWFSYMGIPYKGNCKSFYNINDFEWGKYLEENSGKIKTLALGFLNRKGIFREEYFNKEIVEGKWKWELTSFLFWGRAVKINTDLAKDFVDIFSSVKGLVSLSISILPPHTTIKPHYGDTDAVCRVHIPVDIPALLPECGLKVNNEARSWDQILIFCDAHQHTAWNHTDKYRLVVIADFLLPDLIEQKDKICNNVESLLRLQKLLGRYPVLNNLPGLIKGVVRYYYKFLITFQ